jgi:uncharacterized membrane protein
MSTTPSPPPTASAILSAERAKAFIDAVVAIAMTLLILPLMESVSEAASDGTSALAWLGEHDEQLLSFALSFAIIAMFWMVHHRLFAVVERVTNLVLWLTMAWLLSIVWLPVATALSGQFTAQDAGVRVIYIGSMLLTSVLLLVIRLYLRAHPTLLKVAPAALDHGMAAEVAMSLLFAVALALSLLVPALTYFPLFLLALTGPLGDVFYRLTHRRRSRSRGGE